MLYRSLGSFFLSLLIVLNTNFVLGQSRQPSSPTDAVDEKELAKLLQKQGEQQLPSQAIESTIDPATYLVGPGDVLRVNFWGLSSDDIGLSIKVTPESKIIVPGVGVLDANRKTLQLVQDEIRLACSAKYDPQKVKVTSHLTQVRMVRAHIYGEVVDPGFYTGSAIDRIAHYISEAKGWTQWADERRVQVRHLEGTVDTLDLSQLYQSGDLSQNVYVRGGDVIYFPRIELTHKTVFVEGDVPMPGPHTIALNETVFDFLHRIKALGRGADFKHFYLIRKNASPASLNFMGNDVAGLDPYSTRLAHGDRIIIPTLKEFVYVHGAVQKPGSFPYVVGLKARDYVGMAGGSMETGSLNSVRVLRHDSGKKSKGPEQEVERGDTIIVPTSARKKINDFLAITTQLATVVIAARAVGLIGGSTN